jgi:DNA-3-methyladenine glycosylase
MANRRLPVFPVLPRDFYARKTELVARELLGKHVVHAVSGAHGVTERRARIVETEAYIGAHDLASHSSKGITPRTSVMYGPPGHAYVYLIYGMHHCMNVVTEPEGNGAAVLLRAVEPVANAEGNTKGPGLLCRAMEIDRRLDRADLCDQGGDIRIEDAGDTSAGLRIVTRPRIGVAYAREWADAPLRFYIEGNPFISRK